MSTPWLRDLTTYFYNTDQSLVFEESLSYINELLNYYLQLFCFKDHLNSSTDYDQWLNSAGTGQNGVPQPVSGVPPPEIAVPPPKVVASPPGDFLVS